MNSAAGLGISAYTTSNVGQRQVDNINRSSSTHSGKFNARLEPLVQRHQKLSRIGVRNQNDASYESKNHLEKIDESLNVGKFQMAQPIPSKSGSISISNRKSKPFSANQKKKIMRTGETAVGNHNSVGDEKITCSNSNMFLN